jgi:hypothetical protein
MIVVPTDELERLLFVLTFIWPRKYIQKPCLHVWNWPITMEFNLLPKSYILNRTNSDWKFWQRSCTMTENSDHHLSFQKNLSGYLSKWSSLQDIYANISDLETNQILKIPKDHVTKY